MEPATAEVAGMARAGQALPAGVSRWDASWWP